MFKKCWTPSTEMSKSRRLVYVDLSNAYEYFNLVVNGQLSVQPRGDVKETLDILKELIPVLGSITYAEICNQLCLATDMARSFGVDHRKIPIYSNPSFGIRMFADSLLTMIHNTLDDQVPNMASMSGFTVKSIRGAVYQLEVSYLD
jgi:hypothetical protein